MAKTRRVYFGKILKGGEKDGKKKPDFMAIDKDIQLKEGEFVNLESKELRLQELQESVEAGRLTQEKADDFAEKARKQSDRVRFSLYVVREN